LIPFLAMFS